MRILYIGGGNIPPQYTAIMALATMPCIDLSMPELYDDTGITGKKPRTNCASYSTTSKRTVSQKSRSSRRKAKKKSRK